MRLSRHTVLVAVATIGLLVFFFRQADLGGVWRALIAADPGLLLLALLITGQTYIIRTWRWQILLSPIARLPFIKVLRAVIVGFATIFLLPARAGELIRPWMLSRETGVSASAAFATVIVERLFDLVAVLALFLVWRLLPAAPGAVEMEGINAAAILAGVAAAAALAATFLLAGRADRVGAFATVLARVLPARAATAVIGFVEKFARGLAVMRRPGPIVAALVLSLALWTSIGLSTWVTSLAFGITFPFTASFLLSMFLIAGVAVPTPGGIGGFHAAYAFAVTRLFGATQEQAVACAIVLHAVSFVPVTLVGLVIMAQAGLTIQRARTESAQIRAEGTGQRAQEQIGTREEGKV
ncbi:MAG TPA: lysylphosphatidylglycerol synthase transmembrane domain-containing protein [Vicinamibacterales bacterium]|nr:lysylphosphatidylglycerol synthase transmembrane domain-containing protein [Vicinamibacterales bacterium]